MMGALHRYLFFVLFIGLTACSSRSVDTELTRCVFPDSARTPAPSFVCGAAVSGFPVTALRSSEPSDLAIGDRISLEFADQLTQWSIDWSTLWFLETDKQQLAQVFLLQWLNEHARVVRTRMSPKGYFWILVGQPIELAELEQLTKTTVALQ